MKISLVQAPLVWHDAAANRDAFDRILGGVPDDAQLIVLPEMFSTGFTMASRAVAETMEGPTAAWLRTRAVERGAAIAGSVVIEEQGQLFNRMLWTAADGSQSVYDKRHLFRMADEHHHYAAGDARVIVRFGEWRVLLAVCYDLRFPVWLRCRDDYDLLLCVANWPAARQCAWNTLLRARALENLCYAVGVNRVGTDGNGVAYRGGSAVYDPGGEALAEVFDEAAATTVQVDLEAVRAQRQRFPAWRDADRFALLA